NDSPANALAAVEITTIPTLASGTLTNNGIAVTAGQVGNSTDINASHLVFTQAANGKGSPEASFTFQVKDNGGVANGGVDTDQSANTMTINVTSVNDAPAGTDNTITTIRDPPHSTPSPYTTLFRSNDSPANALAAVEITTIPTLASGTLTNNGIAVTAG